MIQSVEGQHLRPLVLLWRRHLLLTLFLVLFLIYAHLHFAAIVEHLPLNYREPAYILNTQAFLEKDKPPPYSWASLPEQTNLYGPLYVYASAPLALLLEQTPYVAHRLTSGIFLVLSCGMIGILIATKNGKLYGFVGATLFYLANVASPSIAAGPDTLAVFFYVSAIYFLHSFGFEKRAIALSAIFGIAGFLTKPYVVLIIPGMLIYGYLFVSPRKALLAASAIASSFLGTFIALWYFMPAYFTSVILVHFHYRLRDFNTLLEQSFEFAFLNFAVVALFLWHFPWRKLRQIGPVSMTRLFGNQPLFRSPIGLDNFMAIIAAGILLLSMGWHSGNYMVYYNHLLLPPLLIAAFSGAGLPDSRRVLVKSLLLANALLLILLKPSLPGGEGYPDWFDAVIKEEEPILVDPVLEPLSRLSGTVHLVDNGQAEYLVNYYHLSKKAPSQIKPDEWLAEETIKIRSGTYRYLILMPFHNRAHLIFAGDLREPLAAGYDLVGELKINIYHSDFRNRSRFGLNDDQMLVFKRKEIAGEENFR